MVGLVGLRLYTYLSQCVAGLTHTVLDGLQTFYHLRAVVAAAFAHFQQGFQFFARHFAGVAFDAHFAPAVAFALVYFNPQRLLCAVGIVAHIGIFYVAFEEAFVLVEIGDGLQVLAEFFVGETIVFGEPAQHAVAIHLHLVAQSTVGEVLVAFKVDFFDMGSGALVDFQRDVHTVTREAGNLGGDGGGELALVGILLLQAGHGLVEDCLVERLRLTQAEAVEIFLDSVAGQGFAAGNGECVDDGAFHHGQQHLVAHGFYTHVVEQAGGIEVFDDLFAFAIGESPAHFNRQIAQYGGRVGTLQALDADILDGKRCGGQRPRRQSGCKQREGEFVQFHALSQ